MRFYPALIVVLFACLAPCKAFPQYLSLFEAINEPSGLPSNYVFDADEDENGYLWVGTDRGIARFDGFSWKKWDTDNGLPGNYVNTIICNKKGGIYINISRKGSFYFNIKDNTYQAISGSIRDQRGKIDSAGNLYLNEIERKGNTTSVFYRMASSPGTKAKAFDLAEEKPCDYHAFDPTKKNIIHYQNPLLDYPINRVASENGWSSKYFQVKFPPGFVSNILGAIDEFIITRQDVYQADASGNLFLRYQGNDSIYNFLLVNNLKLYIWSKSAGLIEIQKDTGIQHYNAQNGLESNLVRNTFVTSGGAVVACTLGGGLRVLFPPGRKKIALDRSPKFITSHRGKFYANYLDRIVEGTIDSAASFKTHTIEERNLQTLYADTARLIASTMAGVTVFSLENGQWMSPPFYPTPSGASSTIPYKGTMLTSTYGNGIVYISRGNWIPFTDYNGSQIVERLFNTPNGFIAATYEDGIFIFDETQKKTIKISLDEGLLSNSVYDIHQYRDSIWCSTKNGVSVVYNNKVVKNFPLSSGIVGNKVLYSLHDDKGSLWVVSDKYLHHQIGNRFFVIGSVPLVFQNDDFVEGITYDNETNTLITGNIGGILFTKLDLINTDYKVAQPLLMEITRNKSEVIRDTNFKLENGFSEISFLIKPPITNAMIRGNVYYQLKGQDAEFKLLSDSPRVVYQKLRAGEYDFFAKTINPDGVESKPVKLASFSVAPPFWSSLPFILLLTGAIILISIFTSNYINKQRRQNYIQQMEIQKQVQQERERISKDLHDNLGASLVSVIAQSDYLENKALKNSWTGASEKLAGLSLHARTTLDLLRETIWAIQEDDHTVTEFTLRCRNYLQRFYEPTGIDCNVQLNEAPTMFLSSNQTTNLFRCIQEVSQNIVKHSKADSVRYDFIKGDKRLDIRIADNGKGFNTNHTVTGKGLKNMELRLAELNGTFQLKSEIDKGTIIHISIPI